MIYEVCRKCKKPVAASELKRRLCAECRKEKEESK
jgi:hypothetical protein